MIVTYDNGIFWICLGLMMASASLLTLRRNDEGKEEKPKKCMSIHLIYSYVEIQFNCQYMNVCCYVLIFYDHTFSINLWLSLYICSCFSRISNDFEKWYLGKHFGIFSVLHVSIIEMNSNSKQLCSSTFHIFLVHLNNL